ncbi:hypothetical protein FB446DRAFT_699153 [Lentinula raphanica]|nr:hypothetical protein FB446DRAFT_699153 [Lentinula raphanica]
MSSPSNAFHLRPVSDNRHSSSNSPTASSESSSPAAEKGNNMSFQEGNAVVLRDLDLDNTLRGKFPNLPAPPTGHDLMAMFPPAPPSVASMPPNRRTEATSGYFHLQERAYFAQAGKEIIRVRVDVDMRDLPADVEERHNADKRRSRGLDIDMDGRRRDDEMRLSGPSMPLQPQVSPHLTTMRSPRDHREDIEQHASPRDIHSKHPAPTHRRMSIDSPVAHSPPKPRYPYSPEGEHDTRELRLAPPEYMNSAGTAYPQPDDSDEAWRRPTPYAERRRAGKHTRRVVVKN